ncbi:hypothetical protein EB796_019011 [Bugula neritina]|uniref:Uncharacterized protein n=1 Tax=Bugula neritina TaxID=10212 RepID=A0A7J7JAM7_BUGNE|nr:hypothetical protein EB796_019011 [Bugula neritina]
MADPPLRDCRDLTAENCKPTAREFIESDILDALLDVKGGYLRSAWRYTYIEDVSEPHIPLASWIFLDKNLHTRVVFHVEEYTEEINVVDYNSSLLSKSFDGLRGIASTMTGYDATGEELVLVNESSMSFPGKDELITCASSTSGDNSNIVKSFHLTFKSRPKLKCRIVHNEGAVRINFSSASLPCYQKLAVLLYSLKLAYNIYNLHLEPIPKLIKEEPETEKNLIEFLSSLPEELAIQPACFIQNFNALYYFLNTTEPNENRVELVLECQPSSRLNVFYKVRNRANQRLFEAEGESRLDSIMFVCSDDKNETMGFIRNECIFDRDGFFVTQIKYSSNKVIFKDELRHEILAILTETGSGRYSLSLAPPSNPEWKALIISSVSRYLFAKVRGHLQAKLPILKEHPSNFNAINPDTVTSALCYQQSS